MKIVFIGTPKFGAIILEKLIKGGYPPSLVITAPDKPMGRKRVTTPPPVKIIAEKNRIPVEQPEQIEGSKLKIENLKPDLGIVASFGQIIPKEMLNIPEHCFLNVHPSLLPKYRGATPVQAAILNGDKETGVTIIKMTEKLDAGPTISNVKYQISSNNITYEELHDKLAELGAGLLIETIPKWLKKEIKPEQQNESKASYTKVLKKEGGQIDWSKPADVLEKEIRAFYPWPGTYTIWKNKNRLIKIKVLKARVFKSPSSVEYSIGKVLVVPQGEETSSLLRPFADAREKEIGIQCGKNFLVIEKLQMEGKREMAAEDFLRGHSDFMGAILCYRTTN